MAHYKLLFPGKYLGAHDLTKGDATLTIRAIVVEDLKNAEGKDERKPVVYFHETKAVAERKREQEKALILNKTNAATIASLYGTDSDRWIGKAVTIYAATDRAFGKTVECLRIRPTVPTPKQPEPEPTT
jgi:hypothetical protein